MTALETPAPDAPAEEWGELAERIPGWRGPPGAVLDPGLWLDGLGFGIDPDHWAWSGWLLRLLGPYASHMQCRLRPSGEVVWSGMFLRNAARTDTTLIITEWLPFGRACIAYAAALGRWPGVDS